MTTNPDLDQAREVADTIAQSPKAYDSGIQAVARVIASLPDEWIDADSLPDAGLLTPELPEPIINANDGNPEWHADEYTVDVDWGMVNLWTPDGTHWEHTPNQARNLVIALLAAADYAEKENSHAQDE